MRNWRAAVGPQREVFVAQMRRPGELMHRDQSSARAVEVTIQEGPLEHLLCTLRVAALEVALLDRLPIGRRRSSCVGFSTLILRTALPA